MWTWIVTHWRNLGSRQAPYLAPMDRVRIYVVPDSLLPWQTPKDVAESMRSAVYTREIYEALRLYYETMKGEGP